MQNYEALICEAEKELAPVFERLNAIETENTRRVLRAFQKHRVSARNFAPTTGYGYDDIGRDALSEIIAEVFGAEKALMRPQIASGTHALALCLYGMLRPGETLLSAAGTFVSGASIELSADAPIRPPYIAYLQGGLTYTHGRIALEGALQRMQEA